MTGEPISAIDADSGKNIWGKKISARRVSACRHSRKLIFLPQIFLPFVSLFAARRKSTND